MMRLVSPGALLRNQVGVVLPGVPTRLLLWNSLSDCPVQALSSTGATGNERKTGGVPLFVSLSGRPV